MINKFFLFLFFIILSGQSYAQKIEVFYAQKPIYDKYSNVINNTILYLNKNYSQHQDKNFNVYIDVNSKNRRTPYTKVSENDCTVYINLLNEKPVVLKRFTQDLEFLLVHELAHCYYGANHIFDRKIDFSISINPKLNLEDYVRSDNNHKGCFECFQELAFDPFVAYSELLSDIFAINYFLDTKKNYEEFILKLYEYRNTNFLKTEQNTNYISNIFIENFYLSDNLRKLGYEEIKIKAQESLIYFIENRVKNSKPLYKQ